VIVSQSERAIEIKVGALVVFSLFLLGGFIYLLGDFGLDEGTVIHVDFNNIGGLKPGAPVKQGGIQIGTVRQITYQDGHLDDETGKPIWARVEVELKSEYAKSVRCVSAFLITSEGVLGEKFLSIKTPTPEAPPVEAGDIVRGQDPVRIDEVVGKVSKGVDRINELLDSPEMPIQELVQNMNSLVKHADEVVVENRPQLKKLLGGASDAMDRAKTFVDRIDETLIESRPKLRSILTNTEKATADASDTFKQASVTLQRVDGVVRKVEPHVDPILTGAERSVANVEGATERLNSWMTSAEPEINQVIEDTQTSLENVRVITQDTRDIVRFVKSGRGTVGALLNNEEIFDDLREMLRELKRRPWKIVWKE